jgi:2-polyprenyl-3-methyl-5-hydroxy-6-metoxy-1,4-benzoquinol methylase
MYNSDDFDFDTQIIIQLMDSGARICEVPIPTYYGDEICYVNGLKYARDVVRDVAAYRLAKLGLGNPRWVPQPGAYQLKEGSNSSHSLMLEHLNDIPASRILDLGCSDGFLAQRLRSSGHYVVGVDVTEHPGVRHRTDQFFEVDLNRGIPVDVGRGFDVVLAGDVVEHLQQPEALLDEIRRVLNPGGVVLLSAPNFGHWYPRLRAAFGVWDYDRRGILDSGHLRFFSRASIRRLCRSSGFDVVSEQVSTWRLSTGTTSAFTLVSRALHSVLVRVRPQLFAYQFVLKLTPHSAGMTHLPPDGLACHRPHEMAPPEAHLGLAASAELSYRAV